MVVSSASATPTPEWSVSPPVQPRRLVDQFINNKAVLSGEGSDDDGEAGYPEEDRYDENDSFIDDSRSDQESGNEFEDGLNEEIIQSFIRDGSAPKPAAIEELILDPSVSSSPIRQASIRNKIGIEAEEQAELVALATFKDKKDAGEPDLPYLELTGDWHSKP